MLRHIIPILGVTALMPLSAIASDRVTIEAGSFQMGCSTGDPDCDTDEGPEGGTMVSVPEFAIDTREVTVVQYKRCMKAGRCERPKDHARNKYCNLDAEGREDHPINCVDWDHALAYCTWAGGRLPLEAEWEKAARGGTASRYPWGQTASCEQAVLDEVSPEPSDKEPDGCFTDATLPVGSRPANPFGLYDMQGNAGEWTANWYAANAIGMLYGKGDLAGPPEGKRKLVRGGSWDENRPNLRSSYRNVKPLKSGNSVYGSIGFRCAYDG